jgi:transketolase
MSGITGKKLEFGHRRGIYLDITDHPDQPMKVDQNAVETMEKFDLWYRTLCALMFNFVPTSGHPGGSVSSGHIVSSVLVEMMDYDFGDPERPENDLISYAAGHKALGLYAMWASRNEMVRIAKPEMLASEDYQLRLEDMLGFRRNPTQATPLFKKFKAKPLDGHPTPLTPFLKIATGASGVGIPSSFGLALGAADRFGVDGPKVHVIEGEGGLTAGRGAEALAIASSAQLKNLIMHLDWNQSSIDSDAVCRDGDTPGDYVQWDPVELFYLHDWNVIYVPDGFNYEQVIRAQQLAKEGLNDQPTVIVYRTVKGWKYGIEGAKSHGAGHKFCSPEFYGALKEFEDAFGVQFPRIGEDKSPDAAEQNYYDCLMTLRQVAESDRTIADYVTNRLVESKDRLDKLNRQPRADAPDLSVLYSGEIKAEEAPDELKLEVGKASTLRAELGKTLGYLNKKTGGAFFGGAADLLGSTSVNKLNADYPSGFYNAVSNDHARLVACGGICEDAMGALMTGLSSYGYNVGVSSSYAAFIAALEHIAARLHCISQQARHDFCGAPHQTFVMVCAHAGLKTGEDGPTHADPQALQLLQENFPKGKSITLVPWDPQELWPMTVAALQARPALLAPFVTRPNETIFDREEYKLPPVTAAIEGVYAIRRANLDKGKMQGTIILSGSAVMNDFIPQVLPKIDQEGLNINVYYVSSPELFDLLPRKRQEEILPPALKIDAMGISDFTMPTMYRWIVSEFGRAHSMHAFQKDIYPGSGPAAMVMQEIGLDGPAQWEAIKKYVKARG